MNKKIDSRFIDQEMTTDAELSAESQARQSADVTINARIDNITKSSIGLGNVDNTSDIDKPVSTAQEAYINKVAYYLAVIL